MIIDSQFDIESKLPNESELESNQVPVNILRLNYQFGHLLEEWTRFFWNQDWPSSSQLREEPIVKLS